MELRARHRPLKVGALDDRSKKRIRRQQDVIIEEDVVNANDAFLAQNDVRLLGVATVHRQPETEVRVVIQIRTRRDNPINEPALQERNNGRHP